LFPFFGVSTSAVDCPEKASLRNDLLFVEWNVKSYTLTHNW